VAGVTEQSHQCTLCDLIALFDLEFAVVRIQGGRLSVVPQDDDIAVTSQAIARVDQFAVGDGIDAARERYWPSAFLSILRAVSMPSV